MLGGRVSDVGKTPDGLVHIMRDEKYVPGNGPRYICGRSATVLVVTNEAPTCLVCIAGIEQLSPGEALKMFDKGLLSKRQLVDALDLELERLREEDKK